MSEHKCKRMMNRQGVIAGLQCLEFHFRSVAAETTDAMTGSAIDEIVETLETAIDMLRAAPELLATQRIIDPGVTLDAAADASAVKGDRGARMLDGDAMWERIIKAVDEIADVIVPVATHI